MPPCTSAGIRATRRSASWCEAGRLAWHWAVPCAPGSCTTFYYARPAGARLRRRAAGRRGRVPTCQRHGASTRATRPREAGSQGPVGARAPCLRRSKPSQARLPLRIRAGARRASDQAPRRRFDIFSRASSSDARWRRGGARAPAMGHCRRPRPGGLGARRRGRPSLAPGGGVRRRRRVLAGEAFENVEGARCLLAMIRLGGRAVRAGFGGRAAAAGSAGGGAAMVEAAPPAISRAQLLATRRSC